ncbi:hypothetical protein G4B84_001716, partial [Aspergillus flavus NRRL3357]
MASKVPQDTPDSGIIIRAPIFPEDELLEREPKYAFPPIPISDPFFGGVPRTLMPGDIAAQAANVSKDFPSVWFVNFPPSLSGDQKQRLEQYQQEVLDYRSWSSLQWWEAVFRQIPPGPDKLTKMMQSRELAKVAYIDMKRTPWLIKSKDNDTNRRIECKTSEFHARLIQEVVSQFVQLDPTAIAALEPLLMSIV